MVNARLGGFHKKNIGMCSANVVEHWVCLKVWCIREGWVLEL